MRLLHLALPRIERLLLPEIPDRIGFNGFRTRRLRLRRHQVVLVRLPSPSVLLAVVERIAHKHVSLGIRAEHYGIVGKHLLASIQEVLGDAATPELIDAWAAAYGALAELFIGVESSLYHKATATSGGWSGWRPFRISKRVAESEVITSFYFEPLDGGPLPSFKPGQYVSLRLYVAELDLFQPRQYSLSDAPGQPYLRISVKREAASEQQPAGRVSNLLHDQYEEGQIVELSAPLGDFYLQEPGTSPVVLLSGGVGITPMVSILNHLVRSGSPRPIHFIHSARDGASHAFNAHLQAMAAKPGVTVRCFYDRLLPQDAGIQQAPFVLPHHLPEQPLDAEYYLCGPAPFMRHYLAELRQLGVPAANIHAEAFGSGGV